MTDVDAAVEEILQTPKPWPKYLYGTRRFVMRRFPFSIVYLDDPDRITISAVAHGKRKAGLLEGSGISFVALRSVSLSSVFSNEKIDLGGLESLHVS